MKRFIYYMQVIIRKFNLHHIQTQLLSKQCLVLYTDYSPACQYQNNHFLRDFLFQCRPCEQSTCSFRRLSSYIFSLSHALDLIVSTESTNNYFDMILKIIIIIFLIKFSFFFLFKTRSIQI